MELFIGIDPGKNGGVVGIKRNKKISFMLDMPNTILGVYELFKSLPKESIFIKEKVHSMPGNGVASSFSFGWSLGTLDAILAILQIKVIEINPVIWQGFYNLPKTENKYQHKKSLLTLAKKRAKNKQLTLKTCDAYLMALFLLNQKEKEENEKQKSKS